MKSGSTQNVRQMYEAYPYPSPMAGEGLIRDVANMIAVLFPSAFLTGKTIRDVGCGTAHRLLGFATAFPECKFLGIDMTAASLTIAREIAERHGIANVHLQQADLLELNLATEFAVRDDERIRRGRAHGR